MATFWVKKEVCDHFRVARETIRRWQKRRGFPEPIHFGGHERGPCRYDIAEVLAWEARCRSEHKDERPQTPLETEAGQADAHPI